jgi:hypothetical protein
LLSCSEVRRTVIPPRIIQATAVQIKIKARGIILLFIKTPV